MVGQLGCAIVPGPYYVVTTLHLSILTHHCLVLYLVVADAIWLLALRSSPLQPGDLATGCFLHVSLVNIIFFKK